MSSIESLRRFHVAACAAIVSLSGWAFAQSDAPAKARSEAPVSNPADSTAANSTTENATTLEDTVNAAVRSLVQLEDTTNSKQFAEILDELTGLIEQTRQIDPQTPWLDYLHGRMYAATGKPGDAVAQLRKFVETREGRNEWHAYRLLGDLFINEFPRLAQSNYQKAASLNSGEPAVLFGLSRCASMLGRKNEAVNLATQTVDADRGQSVEYLSHLAKTLALYQNWTGALEVSEKAVALAQQQIDASPGQRELLLELDTQIRQTIEILLVRISDATDDLEIEHGYLKLAKFARRRADNGSILSAFDVLDILQAGVERTQPDTPASLLEPYAVALAGLGRTAEAIERFQQLQAADPNNTTAADWLARLQKK